MSTTFLSASAMSAIDTFFGPWLASAAPTTGKLDMPHHCRACECYWFGTEHICTTYDGPACATCNAPTVFVTLGAPGIGQGWSCKKGHYHGTHRITTLAEQA